MTTAPTPAPRRPVRLRRRIHEGLMRWSGRIFSGSVRRGTVAKLGRPVWALHGQVVRASTGPPASGRRRRPSACARRSTAWTAGAAVSPPAGQGAARARTSDCARGGQFPFGRVVSSTQVPARKLSSSTAASRCKASADVLVIVTQRQRLSAAERHGAGCGPCCSQSPGYDNEQHSRLRRAARYSWRSCCSAARSFETRPETRRTTHAPAPGPRLRSPSDRSIAMGYIPVMFPMGSNVTHESPKTDKGHRACSIRIAG